jgi:hypothetical protein
MDAARRGARSRTRDVADMTVNADLIRLVRRQFIQSGTQSEAALD